LFKNKYETGTRRRGRHHIVDIAMSVCLSVERKDFRDCIVFAYICIEQINSICMRMAFSIVLDFHWVLNCRASKLKKIFFFFNFENIWFFPSSATPTTPVSNASIMSVNPSTHWQAELASNASNINNNNSGVGGAVSTAPGMHRSSSAPKMSQTTTPMYNYNNYYQAPTTPAAMSYIYSAPLFQHQRMPPYVAGPATAAPAPNSQQTWSPVVGGTVSAALLRQQSVHSPTVQQLQSPLTAPPTHYAHPYNDNVLRLPRGPCPNGTIGFQMRR